MPATFHTADLHLGHPLVSRLRGFETTDEHDQWVMDLWRKKVKPDDTVRVLGDVTVRSEEYALNVLAELPGRKELIAGNHDPVHPMHRSANAARFRRWSEVFDVIVPFQRKRFNRTNVLLSHFPYMDVGDGEGRGEARYAQYRLPNLGLPLLHGHTHSQSKTEGANQLHVGLDAWGDLVPESAINNWLSQIASAETQ